MSPIFLSFQYFGLCFSCLKFGLWCDSTLKIYAKFLSELSFSGPKGEKEGFGAEFFSALIKYVAAWVAA